MRQSHDVGNAQQSLVDIRLVRIDVQPGTGEVAALERRDQRFLIDQLAARGVDG